MIIPIKLEKRTEGEREAYAEGYAAGKRDAVRHGRWELYDICSVCGAQAEQQTNYCPNCGSRMDLEGDAE